MADYEYSELIENVDGHIRAERQQAIAAMETARATGDYAAANEAGRRIIQLDAELAVSAGYKQMVHQPQRRAIPAGLEDMNRVDRELAMKYGLSKDQYEHATCWTGNGDKEERIKTYFSNTQKYQALRAGGYRDEFDEQGRR